MRLPKSSRAIRRDLATISPADIAATEAFVAGMSATGEAMVGNEEDSIPGQLAAQLWIAGQAGSRYSWNRAILEYMRGSTPVPRVTVKAAADVASQEAQFKMMDAALKMGQGKLNVAQWAVEHDRWVKVLHGAESALARGGFAEMTMADWTAASDRVAYQYGYSRAFFEDVAKGRYGVPGSLDFSEAGVLNRANQYANAGRVTYENTLKDNNRDRLGHTHARRILAAVNSCVDCAKVAAHGWYLMSEYPEIGTDRCHMNCHCVTISGIEGNLTAN